MKLLVFFQAFFLAAQVIGCNITPPVKYYSYKVELGDTINDMQIYRLEGVLLCFKDSIGKYKEGQIASIGYHTWNRKMFKNF